MSKRILDLNTISSASNDDYLVVDGNSGTCKITPENIVGNSAVAQSLLNQISDASDDIDEMQVTIGTLQSEIENIPVIDPTFSQSGQAADAKAVGDELDNIISGDSTFTRYADYKRGNWEGATFKESYTYRISSTALLEFEYPLILHIKTGYKICLAYYANGTYVRQSGWITNPFIIMSGQQFHITVGKVEESVGTQADILEFAEAVTFVIPVQYKIDGVDIYGITGCEKLRITQMQHYINTSGVTANVNSPVFSGIYNYIKAPCAAGEHFTINAVGGSAPRAWAFIDANGNVLDKSASSVTLTNEVITAPSNATLLVINDSGGNTSYRGIVIKKQLADIADISDARYNTFVRETDYNPIPVTYENKYIDTSGSTADIAQLVNFPGFMCSLVPCSEGDTFTISALGGSAPKAWAFVDASGNVLRKTATTDVNNQVEIAPDNSAYLVINDKGGRTSLYGKTVAQTLVDDVTGTDYMQKAIRRITGELKAKSPLGNLLVFGFNTDQHIRDDDNRTVTLPVLRGLRALSKLTQAYPYDFVCLGGDACEAGSYAVTPELILDECVTIQKPLYDAWCPVVPITGNHDAAQNNNTITGGMLFNAHFKRITNSGYLKGWDSTHTNGYIDFTSHKIRVIFIDTTLRADYTAEERQSAVEAMLESTPQDYSIITISHHALSNQLGAKWGTIIAYQNILVNYASRIICCLSGHCHCDLSATSGGILYIGTTLACCANDIDGNARTLNTENETSFDTYAVDQVNKKIYTFRYGFGNNRVFDYDNTSQTFGEIIS